MENGTKTRRPTAFKPGNPGGPGRPKKTPQEFELEAACRAKAPEALAVLERIMQSGANERNQLAAAQAILERGHGKPAQPVVGANNGPIQTHSAIEWLVRAKPAD